MGPPAGAGQILQMQGMKWGDPGQNELDSVYFDGGQFVVDARGGLSNGATTGSGGYWTNESPVLRPWRQRDRFFLGTAASMSGLHITSGGDTWVGSASAGNLTYFETFPQLAVFSTKGLLGIAAASRTSDIGTTAFGLSMGVGSFAFNDNTDAGNTKSAWAYYGHAVNLGVGSAWTATVETEISSLRPVTTYHSYFVDNQSGGLTVGYWLGVGGEYAQSLVSTGQGALLQPCSVALAIANNARGATSNRFKRGIVFQRDALLGTDGTGTGTAIAMEMARGHAIQWTYDTTENPTMQIRSDQSGTASQVRLVTNNTNFQMRTVKSDLATEAAIFSFIIPNLTVANTETNLISFNVTTNATGTPGTGLVQIQAAGFDTNVDIALTTKGAGLLRLSYNSTAATTPANFAANRYIPFKDGSGTTYYLPLMATTW